MIWLHRRQGYAVETIVPKTSVTGRARARFPGLRATNAGAAPRSQPSFPVESVLASEGNHVAQMLHSSLGCRKYKDRWLALREYTGRSAVEHRNTIAVRGLDYTCGVEGDCKNKGRRDCIPDRRRRLKATRNRCAYPTYCVIDGGISPSQYSIAVLVLVLPPPGLEAWLNASENTQTSLPPDCTRSRTLDSLSNQAQSVAEPGGRVTRSSSR